MHPAGILHKVPLLLGWCLPMFVALTDDHRGSSETARLMMAECWGGRGGGERDGGVFRESGESDLTHMLKPPLQEGCFVWFVPHNERPCKTEPNIQSEVITKIEPRGCHQPHASLQRLAWCYANLAAGRHQLLSYTQ